MENREDLKLILEYLPVFVRSSSLFWPPPVVEALKALSKGPDRSQVDSGEVLFLAVSDIRHSLNLHPLFPSSAADGYSLFFDDVIIFTLLYLLLILPLITPHSIYHTQLLGQVHYSRGRLVWVLVCSRSLL